MGWNKLLSQLTPTDIFTGNVGNCDKCSNRKTQRWFMRREFIVEYKDMELTGHLSSFHPLLSAV